MLSQESHTRLRTTVARGAALLDQHRPGWFQRIDPDALKMSDCTACVVGQLSGVVSDSVLDRYVGELQNLRSLARMDTYVNDGQFAVAYGFDLADGAGSCVVPEVLGRDPWERWAVWGALQHLWVTEILARRAAVPDIWDPVAEEPEGELVGA